MSWYYVDPQGVAQGPTTMNALKQLYGTVLTDDTFIWNGTTVEQWTILKKVPSLHHQLSNSSNTNSTNDSFMGTLDRLNTVDIDCMLDEIDANEKKAQSTKNTHNSATNCNKKLKKYKRKHKTKQNATTIIASSSPAPSRTNNATMVAKINWNQIYLHTQSIMNLVESDTIDIDIQNPSDGMTLLMHSIIIGDYDLVLKITNYGANISIQDNDGDDALDYALVFQRYCITELLLSLSIQSGGDGIAQALATQNEMAKYMADAQFGRLKHKIVHFVTKAIKERKKFDINMLYFAWYFTVNETDRSPMSASSVLNSVSQQNVFPDPLQSKLFKTMMKAYWDIISNKSSDKAGWRWLRTHFINSLIWYLPHPNHAGIDDVNALNFNRHRQGKRQSQGSVSAKDARKLLSFLFLK